MGGGGRGMRRVLLGVAGVLSDSSSSFQVPAHNVFHSSSSPHHTSQPAGASMTARRCATVTPTAARLRLFLFSVATVFILDLWILGNSPLPAPTASPPESDPPPPERDPPPAPACSSQPTCGIPVDIIPVDMRVFDRCTCAGNRLVCGVGVGGLRWVGGGAREEERLLNERHEALSN